MDVCSFILYTCKNPVTGYSYNINRILVPYIGCCTVTSADSYRQPLVNIPCPFAMASVDKLKSYKIKSKEISEQDIQTFSTANVSIACLPCIKA